ncbi:MAG: terminase, partial [bacterium]
MNPNLAKNYDVVWSPIEGTSQELAIDTRCHHTLYTGTRGPGKTCTQLMRFRRRVGLGYGKFWRGVIFDREFKNLSDIIAQSKRFFPEFNDGARFLESPSELKWIWPTGEELLFRYVKKLGDYDNFHGHEYPFIGWNELTKHPTGELYDKMMSTNRSSFDPEKDTPKLRNENNVPKTNPDGSYVYLTHDGKPLPRIPLEVFSTTNPSGPGHNWVKRRFILPAPYGHIVTNEIEVYSPRMQTEVTVKKTQVAIF